MLTKPMTLKVLTIQVHLSLLARNTMPIDGKPFSISTVNVKLRKDNAKMITHKLLIKNFVCVTDPSVVTVPFATSKPRSFKAFICSSKKNIVNNLIYQTAKVKQHRSKLQGLHKESFRGEIQIKPYIYLSNGWLYSTCDSQLIYFWDYNSI